MSRAALPVVAISAGDPSGIGPEIIVKALEHPEVRRSLRPLVFGDASLGSELPKGVLRAVTKLGPSQRRPGKPSLAGGRAQYRYILTAIAAVRWREADAVCTAPVNKGQISKAGIPFRGHTEVFAEAFDCPVLMLMEGPRLRVALATNHLPLSQVPAALTKERLMATLELLARTMAARLGRRPRIAVCGLNPHAGDDGALGHEERDVIAPAIRLARKKGIDASGPFAADGLFASARTFAYDVALAMFHDQGLVATKTLDFTRTVNVTLGLPCPRTSPDHGVAYDIAGQGKADALPMVEALLRAARHAIPASR